MRPVHYITIVLAIAVTGILYFGGNTVPPKKEGTGMPASAGSPPAHSAAIASFDSILSAAKGQLPAHAQEEIKTIEEQITAIRDSSRMAVFFDSLGRVWHRHRQLPVAAYYYLQAGKLENSEKKLTFAARLFLDLAPKAASESMQAWEGQLAMEGFKRALEIDPDNDSVKVNLAESYIGTGSTMEGVLLLRDITAKDPDNVAANLMLGQQGIISGQLDKAIGRFERVLKKEPENVAALLGLAEVYKVKGNKEKAIELLEKSKRIMRSPDFDKDIDQYINSFK